VGFKECGIRGEEEEFYCVGELGWEKERERFGGWRVRGKELVLEIWGVEGGIGVGEEVDLGLNKWVVWIL